MAHVESDLALLRSVFVRPHPRIAGRMSIAGTVGTQRGSVRAWDSIAARGWVTFSEPGALGHFLVNLTVEGAARLRASL